jgi:hypothetical protein
MSEKVKKLKDAGVVVNDLPEPHKKVIEKLKDEELDLIIAVSQDLAKADAEVGTQTVTAQVPAYVSFIRF